MFKNKIWNTIQDVAKLEIHPKKILTLKGLYFVILCGTCALL